MTIDCFNEVLKENAQNVEKNGKIAEPFGLQIC